MKIKHENRCMETLGAWPINSHGGFSLDHEKKAHLGMSLDFYFSSLCFSVLFSPAGEQVMQVTFLDKSVIAEF